MHTIFSKFIFLLLFLTIISFGQSPDIETGATNLKISPEGDRLIYSIDHSSGFYVADFKKNKTVEIATEKGSAYQASWSADGNYILFKQFLKQNNTVLQFPAYYDVKNQKIVALSNPVLRCGTPSISNIEKVAYTVGKLLNIVDLNGVVQKTIKLSSYANLTPISPDGKFVIYNDKKDRLWKLNIETEEKTLVTYSETGFFEPIWSPDSRRFVASGLDGHLNIFDLQKNVIYKIGKGSHPAWTADGQWLVYSRADILFNRKIINMDLFAVQNDGSHLIQLTSTEEWEDYPTIDNLNNIYFSMRNNGELKVAVINETKNRLQLSRPQKIRTDLKSSTSALMKRNFEQLKSPLVNDIYFDIPYVNQRYDTPDWFNGNWACGGTAAVQCLSYYGLLQQWPVWASTPYPHISDYGKYICEIYTYNGFTFNIGGRDPNGTIGYGAYGFIIQNNWANTKDYMKQYAQLHGLGSAVDWSPNRTELATEIANDHPFVLLNSLTSAGHYISVIGYVDIDTTTVIVNDPYGDKNAGYANFYGRRAHYDWPGYNNGYENLNTVWCFIYFRGDPPADLCALNIISNVDTGKVGQQIQVSAEITNIGKLPSVPTSVEFFMSENGVYDENAFVLASYNLPILDTAQVFFLNDSIQLPDSLISETYKLSAFVDADTLNKEMLKDNNVASRTMVMNGYPRIYSIRPEDSSIVTIAKPEVRAKFQDIISKIDTAHVKLYLDNTDITNLCTKATRKISYVPSDDLSEGFHTVKVEVPNNYGLTTIENWVFTIQTPLSISEAGSEIRGQFNLLQNYPNPFNPITSIDFTLPDEGLVNIDIYDLTGKKVVSLINRKNYKAGYHTAVFDGSSLASGIYLYRIVIESDHGIPVFTDARKMLLLQ